MYAILLMLIVGGLLLPKLYVVFVVAYSFELNTFAPKAKEGKPPYPEWGLCFGLEKGLIPCPIPAKKSIDDFMDRCNETALNLHS